VIIDGRVVLESGRVTGVQEDAVRDRARASVERLGAVNRDLLAGAAELSPYVLTHCQAMVARTTASPVHGLGLGEAAL
jgi:hypothetical protein